ncbi:MAG: glycosyltransferase [Acidobacteria bacterium]|nr:glycosyltransferase [Acidobacteriota bacterium]
MSSPICATSPTGEHSRLKIARVIGRLNIGGPARHACYLHQSLRDSFDTVLIAGRIDEGEGDMSYLLHAQDGVYWVGSMSRPIHFWNDVSACFRLWRIFRKERPHIVHTHTAKAGALGRLAATLAHVPVRVHTYHGTVFQGYFDPWKTRIFLSVERLLNRLTTQVVAISASQADELSRLFCVVEREKVAVIPTGYDLRHFGDPSSRKRVRGRLGIGDEETLVFWVGRLVAIKNVDLLGRVIASSADKTQLRFLVIGDGPERTKLMDLIRGLSAVTHLGWQSDLAELWPAADVALCTSYSEGTPTALLEAMAAGKPFVATEVGGVADLAVPPLDRNPAAGITRAANGFLTRPCPEAIVHCLEMLARNAELARQMGSAGRRLAMERFSGEQLLVQMTGLYNRLASARGLYGGR